MMPMKKEFEFYIKHSGEINRRYSGKHIAIVGNRVVASGDSAMDVLKKAKQKYPKKRPVLTYVPEKDTLVLIPHA